MAKTGEKSVPLARRIVGDVLLFAAGLLTLDVIVVMTHRIRSVVLKADYREKFVYELILCGILLLCAADVRFRFFTRSKRASLRAAGWGLRSVVWLLSLVILFFCGKVVAGSMIRDPCRTGHAIVLGMALENGAPTSDLIARLDTAQGYLKEDPEAKLILTGGNADGSGRTEAEVMREILTQRGVPEDRMILEDKAKTTKENFKNTVGMLSPDEKVILITSDYHMDRAFRTAKSAGFAQVLRLPAPSGFFTYGANMISEVILDINELTAKR